MNSVRLCFATVDSDIKCSFSDKSTSLDFYNLQVWWYAQFLFSTSLSFLSEANTAAAFILRYCAPTCFQMKKEHPTCRAILMRNAASIRPTSSKQTPNIYRGDINQTPKIQHFVNVIIHILRRPAKISDNLCLIVRSTLENDQPAGWQLIDP